MCLVVFCFVLFLFCFRVNKHHWNLYNNGSMNDMNSNTNNLEFSSEDFPFFFCMWAVSLCLLRDCYYYVLCKDEICKKHNSLLFLFFFCVCLCILSGNISESFIQSFKVKDWDIEIESDAFLLFVCSSHILYGLFIHIKFQGNIMIQFFYYHYIQQNMDWYTVWMWKQLCQWIFLVLVWL